MKSNECVIDTSVLQKANAPILKPYRPHSQFAKRIELLKDIQNGRRQVLISKKLLNEYRQQIRKPRNDLIYAFFDLLVKQPTHRVIPNWSKWSGGDREKSRSKCRFPVHDEHVLRTAIRANTSTTIFTEEVPMLQAGNCIYLYFRVRITEPA